MLKNDMRLDDFRAQVVKPLGEQEGAGANSRPELAVQIAQAAREGFVSLEKDSPDVHDIWNDFQQARAERAGLPLDPEKSRTVQVSKLKTCAIMGVTHHGRGADVLIRARELIPTLNVKGSVFDNMVAVAREQKKSEDLFDDDRIREVLTPNIEEKEYTELGELKKLLAAALKIKDGKKPSEANPDGKPAFPSPEIETVISSIEDRITALDAERKARDAEAAQAKLAQRSAGKASAITAPPTPTPAPSTTNEELLADALAVINARAEEEPTETVDPEFERALNDELARELAA
jgi:hypothetical protein